jgi:hypothetical protein
LAVGEHNDLAGFERDSLAADGGSKASAGRDDVIRNQTVGGSPAREQILPKILPGATAHGFSATISKKTAPVRRTVFTGKIDRKLIALQIY